MSYRPTISVYNNGHIADIGYYRNWDDKDLFYEAFAIAALFYKCKSIPEYNAKKFGRQKVYYSVEPEIFENTEENLKFFESHSERPILVDLTAKCIYISEGTKEKSELLAIPSALEHHKNYGFRKVRRRTGMSYTDCLLAGIPYTYDPTAYEEYEEEIPAVNRITVRNVDQVLVHCRIPFDHVDMDGLLNMFLEYEELQSHLSTTILELLQKEKELEYKKGYVNIMRKSLDTDKYGKESSIVCDLHVGEHLRQIRGMDYYKSALAYKVEGEYPYHYLIGIKYRTGLTPDCRNYVYTSVSKASIYCGAIVLIKKDGRIVRAVDKYNSRGVSIDKEQ